MTLPLLHAATGDDVLHRPAFVQPVNQSAVVDTRPPRPFRDRQCLSVHRGASRVAAIAGLLKRRGPAAILRRIRTIVIDALYGVFRRRAAAHVSQERLVTRGPSVAHSDSSVEVLGRSGRLRTSGTAVLHQVPNLVLGSDLASVSVAVRYASAFQHCPSKAAATDGRSVGDVSSRDPFTDTASAPTQPFGACAKALTSRLDVEHGQRAVGRSDMGVHSGTFYREYGLVL